MKNKVSKASQMGQMYDKGMSISEIAKELGVRYQHVYNVISMKCIKEGSEVRVTRKNGEKKEMIITLLGEGKSVKDICREVDSYETYVRKIRKEWLSLQ